MMHMGVRPSMNQNEGATPSDIDFGESARGGDSRSYGNAVGQESGRSYGSGPQSRIELVVDEGGGGGSDAHPDVVVKYSRGGASVASQRGIDDSSPVQPSAPSHVHDSADGRV
eukprot:CAMPEP_0194043248 /NCGR_PEP_ID=MMETSP0009_2-20130614/14916_1 /TAXON_ID=210454 /ORGANISM="Grammatophora oceanica, Strain CCMP 410" /LENGTH=112 /DNA_ID=CAMNT_0038687391 /DNA_START=85 /DNA_END=423 /DNA_ORIENTATION=+